MNPFSGLTLPIAGVLVLSVLGLFGYHKLVVSAQQTKITNLESANAQLKNDVDLAVKSNASLTANVEKLQVQSNQLVDIIKTVQAKDVQVGQWFESTRAALISDASRQEIVNKLKDNPAGAITDANAEIECAIINFGKLGSCVGSTFVPYTGAKQ